MTPKIKVAIADDHGLMRQGLIAMLQDSAQIEIIGNVDSGEGAVNMANELAPDIFLIDIVMRGMSGIEATRWIKEHNPKIKIILMSSEVNKDYITDGIKCGIDGYVHKNTDQETLVHAIQLVVKGERYFSPEISALIFEDFYLKETEGKGLATKKTKELTKREDEVLALIAQGKSLKIIADELFISIKTVETHKMHIYAKLGITNSAQLVRFAIENNVVEFKKKAQHP